MSRITFIVLVLLAPVACRDRIIGTTSELRVGQRVIFPNAFVGQTKHAQLEVTNAGRSKRGLTAATLAPFTTEGSLEVPGASTVALELTFAPTDAGLFVQPLDLDSEGEPLQVTLVGTGEPPLDCAGSSPCRASHFDLAFGSCVERAVNEGLDCSLSNACYAQARCVAGDCVGTAVDCDDHDACSTDVCDSTRGCVHFAATARCPAPPDPCHVSACDSVAGCIFVNALDGTRCGPADCSSANICILGQCKLLPVGEGASCGDPSPCQPRGRCAANICVRPAPTGLVTAWTHWSTPGWKVDWDSIADHDDNIYWREHLDAQVLSDGGFSAARWQLVTVKNDGTTRWTQPLTDPQQIALVDGILVVRLQSSIDGRRISDGELIWSRDFSAPDTATQVRTLSRGLGGALYVGWARSSAGEVNSTINSLNVFNGATLWTTPLPGQDLAWQTMPVDENGYSYAGVWQPSTMKRRFVGLTPSGTVRWSIVNPHEHPAAVFGGRVYHWDHWLSETSDAGWVNSEPPTLSIAGYPRLALGAISYVGSGLVDAGICGAPDLVAPQITNTLVRVDPATSLVKWQLLIAAPDAGGRTITNPVLTSRSTVMFSQDVDYCGEGGYVLREVSPSGEPTFSCPLPSTESYHGEGLLAGGKWVVSIQMRDGGQEGVRAIELPGFALPEHGWATAWGSSSRDNHAR